MPSFEWAPDIQARVVRRGWEGWLAKNWGRIDVAVRAAIPVLTGNLKASYWSHLVAGGKFGTKKLVVETRARYSWWVHHGRGPVVAKAGGPLLSWLTAISGGRLAKVPDGTRVAMRRVRGTFANPYLIKGLTAVGLRPTGYRPNPRARGVRF